jgi:hypothetical protein
MSLLDLTAAVADQLEQRLAPVVDVIQVTPWANRNPTPPAIDIFPADPFQEPDSYGRPQPQQAVFVVRARVTDLDIDSGQMLLLEMMDPGSPKSVAAALAADGSFAGTCQDSSVEGPAFWGEYTDASGETLLGCQWRLRTILL